MQQTSTSKKNPRERKNYRMAELYAKQRAEQNEARGRQIWVGGKISEGGYWERTQL